MTLIVVEKCHKNLIIGHDRRRVMQNNDFAAKLPHCFRCLCPVRCRQKRRAFTDLILFDLFQRKSGRLTRHRLRHGETLSMDALDHDGLELAHAIGAH